MSKYLFKKFLISIVFVVLSSVAFFWLIRLIPGNPVGKLVGYENYNVDVENHLIKKYGLDKSVWEQFVIYFGNLLKGDLGYSYISKRSVTDIISSKIVPTLLLVIPSIIISYVLGIYLAVKSEKYKKMEYLLNKITAVFNSVPTYILCLFLIYVFSYKLKIFPVVGMYSSRYQYVGLQKIIDVFWHLILPVACIVIIDSSYYYRIMKDSIRKEKEKEYCYFLDVNGVSEEKINNKYILRNSIMPTINVLSFSAARIVTGALYIEILFAWPGMGRLIYESILSRDYLVLSSSFLIIVLFISIFMILVDVIYCFIDPRVRKRRI